MKLRGLGLRFSSLIDLNLHPSSVEKNVRNKKGEIFGSSGVLLLDLQNDRISDLKTMKFPNF